MADTTFPILPVNDSLYRMRNFPPENFSLDESSTLYKFVDALIGDSGAGGLRKQMLIARLSQKLDTTFFGDLDIFFGNIAGIIRTASETYAANPSTDLLTSDEWDEIRVKDAWYRARIKDFFAALALGGSPDGIRKMVKAAIGIDSEVYEMWRFQDHYADIYGVEDMHSIMNLIRCPSNERSTAGWTIVGQGSGGSYSRVDAATAPTGAVVSGNWCFKVVTGTSSNQVGLISDLTPAAPPAPYVSVTPLQWQPYSRIASGHQYTASFHYFIQSISFLTKLQFNVLFYDLSFNLIGTHTGPLTNLVASSSERVSTTFTTPSNPNLAYAKLSIRAPGAIATSTTIYFDAMQLSGGLLQPYFDGNTSGYRWSDVKNSSISIKESPIDGISRFRNADEAPPRNEIVIYPHKSTLTSYERFLIKELTARVAPVDSIVTVASTAYGINVPILTKHSAADSTYFQIQSYVYGLDIDGLTEEEESNASHRWLQKDVEKLAPNPAFLESQEYSQYYTYSKAATSAIDSVKYYKANATDTVRKAEKSYATFTKTPTAWTPWIMFDIADSPDNYPGGKNGRTPTRTPALTKSGAKYIFQYTSQADYVNQMRTILNTIGGQTRKYVDARQEEKAKSTGLHRLYAGQATEILYRLPIAAQDTISNSWPPEQGITSIAPVKASTVSSGWFSRPLSATNSATFSI